jgi:probable F420-dependent oxidoreductase
VAARQSERNDSDMTTPVIGRLGVWSSELRFGDKREAREAAATIEELGYGAIWIPGGIDDAVLGDVERLLDATHRIVVATGILNLWKHDPADVARWFANLPDQHRGRVLLGVGVSHGPIIGESWGKPLEVTGDYLDRLEQAKMPLSQVCLAALGPKMLRLSGGRTAGAHPYLVSPQHTAQARAILGPERLLAPEQGVILAGHPDQSRAMAEAALEHYSRLPNYRMNWERMGFTAAQIDALDPALLEAIFAMGSVDTVKARVEEHWQAGADHVCLQVIDGPMGGGAERLVLHWRTLAEALL